VTGGGGNLLCSFDGGKTWFKDESVGDVPSNFYKVKFVGPERALFWASRGPFLGITLRRPRGKSEILAEIAC
jgi:photosystem II stability/assembly factor-like uncharacterized protein